MNYEQPELGSKHYSDLICEIEKGIIKIPRFQRGFVWSIEKTAELLDSILKGYPIGTFILWQTNQRVNDIKQIGDFALPDTPEGVKVQYLLDGQQRIISLFAAYRGAMIPKTDGKKITDYKDIFVNLDSDDPIITAEKPEGEKHVSLYDVLNFSYKKGKEMEKKFDEDEMKKINAYSEAFKKYKFSTVVLMKDDASSAIEVFTRINTGGKTLTLFEIMSAKTYDEDQKFDMQAKWSEFTEELEKVGYEGISSMVALHLISLITKKDCRRRTILSLKKRDVIDRWDDATSALKESIDYFRNAYGIPVSQLLPYDSLLVPFAYFFHFNKKPPRHDYQRRYLKRFFWRAALSFRYQSATETKLAQDIVSINLFLKERPTLYRDIRVDLESEQLLIDTEFSTSNSYCKAVLCLLASRRPKDFQDNGQVVLDNSWLKRANSKNYHHFFPKAYLNKMGIQNGNSLMNITFVSDRLNKKEIGSKSPSNYIGTFQKENPKIGKALNSHFIGLKGFGIENDDYQMFLKARAKRIFDELKSRIDEDPLEGNENSAAMVPRRLGSRRE